MRKYKIIIALNPNFDQYKDDHIFMLSEKRNPLK